MEGPLTVEVRQARARIVGADTRRVLDRPFFLLIDGALVPASSGRRYVDTSPATLDEITQVPDGGTDDVAAAVEAAKRASPGWRRTPVAERSRRVRAVAELVHTHAEELAQLDAIDVGNPISAMRRDVRIAVENIEMFADFGLQIRGETLPGDFDHLHATVLEPYGVVGRIVAFNHPLMFSAAKIAAPLVAGNAVVLKPPEIAPLSALRLGELVRDVLPPGVLSIVVGESREVGRALVRHPDVKRVAFTGSVATGMNVQREAAEICVKHVTLELGGKNALIVCADADLDAAAAAAATGAGFAGGQGQSCGSTSRLLVHESIKEKLLNRLLDHVRRIRLGWPLDPDVQMGPMASQAQYDKTLGYIELGVREGAEIRAGGGPPPDDSLSGGLFIAPTVLDHVEPSMRVAREEIFGPVLSVISWREPEEAVAIANDVSYGLTAGIYTSDFGLAHRFAQELDAGYIWINEVGRHYAAVPFGGFKSSGVGREESLEELRSYSEIKAINMRIR
jgi:2-formylbenzoate dehydrogenase